MTRKFSAWKKSGSELLPIFEFSPPKSWSGEKIKDEQQLIIEELTSSISEQCEHGRPGWIELFLLLPEGLQKIIAFEVLEGNSIISIGKSAWPNPDSIVVNLKSRFHPRSRQMVSTARWRMLDDAHYCKEEIIESILQTDFLIIV